MRENLVTVREAASYLRISARTVYRLIESGQIGAVRIGKQWRIPAHDLPGRETVPPDLIQSQSRLQPSA